VAYQTHGNARRFPPEPWNGHLADAKILFLSSNPSAAEPGVEPAPYDVTSQSSDDALIALFDGAFDVGLPRIENGVYWVDVNGQRHAAVSYWASVRARAEEILGRPPVPGIDYALTEVVHCGSRKEHEVEHALDQCVDRYLEPVLSISSARVVIVLGSHAASAFPVLPANPEFGLIGRFRLGRRDRLVVRLPHPNRIGPPKTVSAYVTSEGFSQLTSALAN
jgi:hypothetical protein